MSLLGRSICCHSTRLRRKHRHASATHTNNTNDTHSNDITIVYQTKQIQVCPMWAHTTYPPLQTHPSTYTTDPSAHKTTHSALACWRHTTQWQCHRNQLPGPGYLWHVRCGDTASNNTAQPTTAQRHRAGTPLPPPAQQQQPTSAPCMSGAHHCG